MITVICPVFNEEKNIQKVINFFLEAEPKEKELLIVDGGSTDNTLSIIREAIKKNPYVHLYLNKKKYVPFALNIALKNSKGDPIIRLDAHAEYVPNYFIKILEVFEQTHADIVGGPMRAVGKTNFQKAVAYATGTIFGVGDSKIHQETYIGESDHVYLGAWKRKLFDEIGYFDERLKRNQDEEFHYRARSMGKKIYLNPEIKSYYYPRDSIHKLIKQYFQYGLFKPIVSYKIKSEIKIRHIVPSVFLLYLFLLIFFPYQIVFLPLAIYLLLCLLFSIRSQFNFKSKLITIFIFPSIHLSYGFGYLLGLIKLLFEGNYVKTLDN